MLYACECGMVGIPNHFTTSFEMRFFWLPLSTMNCSGEPFTHICEWKRCSPSSRSPGSFFYTLAMATVALGSPSMICFPFSFPLSVLTQGHNMYMILKPSTQPPATTCFDTHLCYERGSYRTHTTFPCPSLTSWCCSLLAASTGCLGSPSLGFVLFSSDSQIQNLTSFV